MVERIAANADKKGSSVSEAAKRCLTVQLIDLKISVAGFY